MTDPKSDCKQETLTDEQVANWRKILSMTFGPYAFVMPREQVQMLRDRLQSQLDSGSQNDEATAKA